MPQPPPASTPPWMQPFTEAAALGLKVAVVDTSAHMLACANLAGHLICTEANLLGDKWHEFVDPRDLPRIRATFARRAARTTLVYRQLSHIDGQPCACRIGLVNVWIGSVWLCYGAVEPIRPPRRRFQGDPT